MEDCLKPPPLRRLPGSAAEVVRGKTEVLRGKAEVVRGKAEVLTRRTPVPQVEPRPGTSALVSRRRFFVALNIVVER